MSAEAGNTPITRALFTIFCITFSEFLIVGVGLGTLPSFVHDTLHFNNLVVGVVVGSQFVATLLTRPLAGRAADYRGGRRTAMLGMMLSAVSAICCLGGTLLAGFPALSLLLIVAGRILLGIGESYLVIGIFAWGFAIVGPKSTGKVMVWNGLGMQAGLASGAPAGIYLESAVGIPVVFAICTVIPLAGYLASTRLPIVPLLAPEKKLSFWAALKTVSRAGMGLALGSIGFSGIASFITLYFGQQGWHNASLALTAYGVGYIVMRLFFAHYPDKFGGARVAMACLFIEMIGQALLWLATNEATAIGGAVMTGAGMSLVFPAFGRIAIKNVPVANRGTAMAAYNAFFDLGVGVTAPVAGLIAGGTQYELIYLFGAIAACLGLWLAVSEHLKPDSHH
jgi:MFS family permease